MYTIDRSLNKRSPTLRPANYHSIMAGPRNTPITFVTANKDKAEKLSRYLKVEVDHLDLDLAEVQSLDLEHVAKEKVKRASEYVKHDVLVEDVSLEFDALGGLPGPLVKWFLKAVGNEGLIKMLESYKSRQARAKVVYALSDDNGIHLFSGETEGEIAQAPRGTKGFGWDSIFIPDEQPDETDDLMTWGQMDDKERALSSMRKPALEKLRDYVLEEKKNDM